MTKTKKSGPTPAQMAAARAALNASRKNANKNANNRTCLLYTSDAADE